MLPTAPSLSATPTGSLKGVRVHLVVNKDWYFLSHRVPLARALHDAGATVTIVAGATGREREIEALGFRFVGVPFDRGSINPLQELSTVQSLYRVFRREGPDVVHNIAVKATLYGTLAARAAGVKSIINTITGLGYLFTGDRLSSRVIRWLLSPVFRIAGNSPKVRYIFFNSDDRAVFCSHRFTANERSTVIPGSGVDVEGFPLAHPEVEPPIIVMCARLLRDKGIYELIAAGRQLYSEGLTFRLVIAGSPDSSNPNSCSEAEIAEWKKEPWLDLPGFVRDTKKLLTNASIAVLPSYREGMPLFLLEAMAAGLPIVTTDVPGCRETVPDNQTGRLVKVKDRGSLAQALRELIKDSSLRKEMGKVSRRLAATHFSKDHVSAETLALYSDLLISDS